MIEITNANKTYITPTSTTEALKNINIKLPNTGLILLCGESGSGKTTLLNCIGGLDKLSSGSITGNSKENCSLIFQDFQLLEHSSIYDNLFICQSITKNHLSINECLKKVSLDVDIHKNVNQLSGGQKQRVAIARALILNRNILLADEPTGNLDSKTSKEIAALLKEISKEKLVIVVSHDKNLFSNFADRQIELLDGSIIRDEVIIEPSTKIQKEVQNNFVDKLKFGVVRKIVHSQAQKNISKNITSFIIVFLTIVSITTAFQIIFNTKAKSILTAAKEANYSTVNFGYENNDYAMRSIDNEYIDKVKDITNDNYLTYHDTFLQVSLNNEDNTFVDGIYYYTGNHFNSRLEAGTNDIKTDQTIISNKLAIILSNKLALKNTNELIGKQILVDGYPLVIKGVEQANKIKPSHKSNIAFYEDLDYIYINNSTYANFNNMHSNKASLRFNMDTRFENISAYEKNVEIIYGRAPENDDEICLSKSDYFSLSGETDLSNLGTKTIEIKTHHIFYEKMINYNKTFKVVGITNRKKYVSAQTLKSMYEHSEDYYNFRGSLYAGIFTKDLTIKTINKLSSIDINYFMPISDEINMGYSILSIAAYTLLILVIPFAIILFVYQTNYAKQNIITKKREIGILKSMSIGNKQISKVLIYNPIMIIFIVGICSAISGPLLVNLINNILKQHSVSVTLLTYNPLINLIIVGVLIILILIITLINIKRLNKKSDIDLVYER